MATSDPACHRWWVCDFPTQQAHSHLEVRYQRIQKRLREDALVLVVLSHLYHKLHCHELKGNA